jgi:hypothetical protein
MFDFILEVVFALLVIVFGIVYPVYLVAIMGGF